jgi:hypothetical protein
MSTFQVGQRVKATCSYANQITEGKTYTIVEIQEPFKQDHFTFPEYTIVIGDFGKKVSGHSHRWRALTEGEGNA